LISYFNQVRIRDADKSSRGENYYVLDHRNLHGMDGGSSFMQNIVINLVYPDVDKNLFWMNSCIS